MEQGDRDYHKLGDEKSPIEDKSTRRELHDVPQDAIRGEWVRELPKPDPIEKREVGQRRAMGFDNALVLLKLGKPMQRTGWNGKGMWIALQEPDANSKMTLPYLYMRTAQGDLVPWLASQTDLLAIDWKVAGDIP